MGSFAKPLCLVLGVVFLAIGALGFVMPSPLLGIFETDPMHNIVHLLSGVLALGAGFMGGVAPRMYLLVFGAVYALVAVLGFVMPSPLLGLISVNMADNFLHIAIAAACLVVGGMAKGEAPAAMPPSHPSL
jgi:hypothetical protein